MVERTEATLDQRIPVGAPPLRRPLRVSPGHGVPPAVRPHSREGAEAGRPPGGTRRRSPRDCVPAPVQSRHWSAPPAAGPRCGAGRGATAPATDGAGADPRRPGPAPLATETVNDDCCGIQGLIRPSCLAAHQRRRGGRRRTARRERPAVMAGERGQRLGKDEAGRVLSSLPAPEAVVAVAVDRGDVAAVEGGERRAGPTALAPPGWPRHQGRVEAAVARVLGCGGLAWHSPLVDRRG